MSLNNDSVLKDLAAAMEAARAGIDRYGQMMQKLSAPIMEANGEADTPIRKNAAAVCEGKEHGFSSTQFEDAMFRRADELAAYHRITPEQALLKGLKEDDIIRHLAHAAQVAQVAEYTVGKRAGSR